TPPLRYQSLAGTAPAARDGERRIVRGDIFAIKGLFPAFKKCHRSPAPLRLLSASDHACCGCSVASAHATPPLRYQSLAGTAPAARDDAKHSEAFLRSEILHCVQDDKRGSRARFGVILRSEATKDL
ncbi:MAG: hypothetical protein IJQ26_06015, partial [Lachnospiraceae bacterium]|nr:hypothetical protein [Lachnospiraceae bacterium]